MLMAGKHVQVSNTQSLNNVSSSLVKIHLQALKTLN